VSRCALLADGDQKPSLWAAKYGDAGTQQNQIVVECYQESVLKNSLFPEIAEILEMENVYQNRDRRLWSFLLLSFFDGFPVSEFFNSHRI
jgi:hypothetical protein